MSDFFRTARGTAAPRRGRTFGMLWIAALAACLMSLGGCSDKGPAATVEGTLRMGDQPLERCLITFLPEPGQDENGRTAVGLTDQQGHYRLQLDNQQPGAAVGWHRVVVQDLLISTGVRRRDHGLVDAEIDESEPLPRRDSRVPEEFTSVDRTPIRKKVEPGHQVFDLDIP